MTSVLYSAGLNYQAGNPVRTEINKLTNAIADLRKIVDEQGSEIRTLKALVTSFESLKSEISRLDGRVDACSSSCSGGDGDADSSTSAQPHAPVFTGVQGGGRKGGHKN
jgi:hypothetical protein